jgi:hypothetical protein
MTRECPPQSTKRWSRVVIDDLALNEDAAKVEAAGPVMYQNESS